MDTVVLFVDDEKAILGVLETLFRAAGFTTRATTDTAEALRIVREEGVRVCFTDLRMPVMNGMMLCREIKKIAPDAFVFALSAFTEAHKPAQYREAGFEAWFPKPFKTDVLLGACNAAFEKLARLDAERNAASGQAAPAP